MYEKFYRLRMKPFEITPDPRFLFLSESHGEALAHLVYAINESKGFTVISGEVGTGKTTIVLALLRRLGKNIKASHIFHPKLSPTDFLNYICWDLGCKKDGAPTKGELVSSLFEYLLECNKRSERVVLIVDEAHLLDDDLFEEVRLLTNLETAQRKLLQVVLVGQPELDKKLDTPSLRQLKQRISIRYRLEPMSRRETEDYVLTRLKVAGARNTGIFDSGAMGAIYDYSRGIPRIINVVCDNALIMGYAREIKVITKDIILDVVRDLEGTKEPKRRFKFSASAFAAVVGVVMLIGVGLLFYGWYDGWFDHLRVYGESVSGYFRKRIFR